MREDELGIFLAQLSTGDWLLETVDLVGMLSPWQILMERCKREKIYLTDLRLRAGQWLVETRPNAPGYFYAVKLFRGLTQQGSTEEIGYKGVGWVTEDRQGVEIMWASTRLLAKCCLDGPQGVIQGCGFVQQITAPLEPRACERCTSGRIHTAPDAWRETRSIIGSTNIIWSNPREGGSERDTAVQDGYLWMPDASDRSSRIPGESACPR